MPPKPPKLPSSRLVATPHDLLADEPSHDGLGSRALEVRFGFLHGQPCAALFVGDADEPILLPRDLLDLIVRQGWYPADADEEAALVAVERERNAANAALN